LFAEVLLPIPVPGTFTYRVPYALNDQVRVGQRAVVQFGKSKILSGLIVGLPEIPEMGKDMSEVVCYDLACRNCYDDYIITKPLQLKENGMAHCRNCNRDYNLNDLGHTENGKPLFRYRARLIGNTLVIAN
jgi:hypothetical protein